MIKKLALILLTISVFFLVYVVMTEVSFVKVSGNSKVNHYSILRLIVSIYFSVLILIVLIKKSFTRILNVFWLLPLLYLFFKYIYGIANLKKMDSLIGNNINSFEISEYYIKDIPVKEIKILGNNKIDTIYYSGNPCCDSRVLTVQDLKTAKVSKSFITGYYYLTVPTKTQKNK